MRLEHESELQELKRKRMECISELKSFKEELKIVLQVDSTTLNVLEEKKRKLREFAFHANGDKTVEKWNEAELAQLFATFGMLSDIESQIQLYELVRRNQKPNFLVRN